MIRYSLVTALALSAAPAFAQPGPPPGRGPAAPPPTVDSQIERLLTFDANKDGALSKAELTDERLHALFARADADHDGTATKAEFRELLEKENAALASSGRRGGPDAGQPGPGGPPPSDEFRRPGGRGPMNDGQPGPPRDDFRGQRPRLGQVLPLPVQERLGLSEEQRRKVKALQEIVDTQLESILTPEQREMLGTFGPPQAPPDDFGGRPRGDGPPRERQRPNAGDRPMRPASEP